MQLIIQIFTSLGTGWLEKVKGINESQFVNGQGHSAKKFENILYRYAPFWSKVKVRTSEAIPAVLYGLSLEALHCIQSAIS